MTQHPAAPDASYCRAPPETLCLDFVNTRYWRGTASPTEELQAPADLLRWLLHTGTLDGATLRRAEASWKAAPAQAETCLATALALREAIGRIVVAAAAGGAPPAADFSAVDAALRAAPARAGLRPQEAAWGWELPRRPPAAGLLLAPVLWSAGDLLAGLRLHRVRQCANPECRWVFLDDSKGATRRWCSMASCGNRAKAHRHYARRRQAAGGTAG